MVYDVIGSSVCMGDHKPVYLAFTTAVDDVSNGNAKKAEAVIKNGPKEQKCDATPNETDSS